MDEFVPLRRRLALAGGWPVHGPVEALRGRTDEPAYRVATLVDPPLRHVPVNGPVAWREPVAFLDGTQRTALIGYVGTLPVLAATIRAAVRVRRERCFAAAVEIVRRVVVARREALDAFAGMPAGFTLIEIAADDAPHPIRDLDLARAAVDRTRAAAEIEMARRFRGDDAQSWLVVDGSLAVSPDLSNDPRAVGVVKSHAMLPFQGDELRVYLTVPLNARTSRFMPQSRQVTPVHAWGLRLHDPAGHDLFHGLVRVEVAAVDANEAVVDALSGHLLAERAPLAHDPRADRLLYGIHDVERYLRALG
jgi:hypothetical protein